MVTFGVLGPLTAGSARLGGPKQRAVLARLLVARRRVVPVRTLVADLWEEPPDGAVGTVQTFVGALRKALEPDRPPRTPSALLVTEGAGYALLASDVDAWRFEEMLGGDLSVLDSALALWRGPAYGEFADEHWARAEIDRLEELRLVAVERRAEAALALGRAAGVVADLRAHLADHPWREKAWSLLALALYREGRQGDALQAVRDARHALVENLGVDPGPELRALESDILAQAPRLRPSPESSLVGRAAELALLETAVPVAGLGIALVTGEAGVGKTALATAFTELLAGRGWRTVWARCQEDAPVAWPWQQVVEALGEELGAADRFRLRLSIVSTVESAAPVLVVLDDLHQADEETLAVLTAFTGRVLSGRVLIVATSRSAVPSEALARAEPVRAELDGLDEEAVAALVGRRDARVIHQRTGGNPFYVKELGRLVASGGDLGSVPAGVRDVLRHRLAGLPAQARTVLHQASVLGRDVEVDLLAALAGHDVLDALDLAIEAGFVVEVAPGHIRFTHALVRDTLYEDVSLTRRARWHAALTEVLPPGDVQTLAHHYALAGTRGAAAVTALARAAAENRSPREAVRLWRAALVAAGSERLDLLTGLVRALAVSGDLEGARERRSAALRLAEGREPGGRGTVASPAVASPAVASPAVAFPAVAFPAVADPTVADPTVPDPDAAAEVIGSFDVPGIWTTNDDPAHSAELVAAAERTLPAFPGPTATRARLLATIAMEDRGTGARLGEAREAEAIAGDLGDPALRAFALNARFMHTFHRTGLAPERAAIGRELLEVASGRLVTHEVLGHLILVQACSALADFGTADQHATAADELAQRHDLPLVGLFTDWYAALKLAAAGRTAEADSAYRAAAERVKGTGMWGMERGLLPLALLSLHGPSTVDLADDWGPHLDWVRPLALPHDEALKAARALRDGPADLLTEVRACLLAMAATRLRDDELAERAHALLLPARDELVAGTGLFTFGPVRDYLRG
ncbi:DNA-binding transcriptional activator of the SARP family [Lentzea waywayandensis]|uniref:DNA-binding transcriptional activator of the SARP family n=1 Tax=Lentzea waywayandensis TaxID=84724 RepID=A0A1I6F7J1_9PSEU|nr:BTAD domain-containing putative transcriptional regulator [Lentzea waywayandensis]SFR25793.1 DNA-binding transcriptional activator of the SARP family [Lentzea waywayandensis]